jgi:hypothetical protein
VTYSRQLLRVLTRKELIVSVEAQLGLQVKENALLACAEQDWDAVGRPVPVPFGCWGSCVASGLAEGS